MTNCTQTVRFPYIHNDAWTPVASSAAGSAKPWESNCVCVFASAPQNTGQTTIAKVGVHQATTSSCFTALVVVWCVVCWSVHSNIIYCLARRDFQTVAQRCLHTAHNSTIWLYMHPSMEGNSHSQRLNTYMYVHTGNFFTQFVILHFSGFITIAPSSKLKDKGPCLGKSLVAATALGWDLDQLPCCPEKGAHNNDNDVGKWIKLSHTRNAPLKQRSNTSSTKYPLLVHNALWKATEGLWRLNGDWE